MAFVKCEDTERYSQCFVQKLQIGFFQKDFLTNHGDVFFGDQEKLALSSFVGYIGSARYVMMKLRCAQENKVGYYGN